MLDSAPLIPAAHGPQYVSLILVSAVADALRQVGAGPYLGDELSQARARLHADARAVMSRRRFLDALLDVRRAMGEPALGLMLGDALTEMSLHFVGPLLASRTTLRDAMNMFFDLKRAVLCGAPWMPETVGDQMLVGHRLERELGVGAELEAEIAVTATYRNVVHWLGAAGRREVCAMFAFRAPPYLDRYRALYGEQVEFGAPLTGISIPLALLDRERPGADHALAAEVREFADRWLPDERERSWSERVRHEFARLNSLAEVDFEALATRWGMSLRSLRRRLESEQTRLSALLEEARYRRATDCLTRRTHSLPQIAEQLGYLEVNSFQRAFKRWAGMTPGEFRRRAARPHEQVAHGH